MLAVVDITVLVEEIGGPETPGIGFALSIERFIAALNAEGIELEY